MIEQVLTNVYKISTGKGMPSLGRVLLVDDGGQEVNFCPEGSVALLKEDELNTIVQDMQIIKKAYEGDEELLLKIKGKTHFGKENKI
jgi:hypothetical protein